MKQQVKRTTIERCQEMIEALGRWLSENDYRYVTANYIPDTLLCKSRRINTLTRTILRLSPIDLRPDSHKREYPNTPQANISLLKAFEDCDNYPTQRMIVERLLQLRSPRTKNFALCQGVEIHVRLYSNGKDDPTPLNTVWFGEYLLSASDEVVDNSQREKLLRSICDYLIEELGYIDFGQRGIYFYYGPTLKKIIYNASAKISALLIAVGLRYDIPRYRELGERGVEFIVSSQNSDGSWFYAAAPARATIDNFHISYILQSLYQVKDHISFDISETIEKGVEYYYTLFRKRGNHIVPIRYDKRFTPHNTWLFQRFDGRDISEAIILFTTFHRDRELSEALINYTFEELFDKTKGTITPERFIYGKNRTPYIEFQGWYLYALNRYLNFQR